MNDNIQSVKWQPTQLLDSLETFPIDCWLFSADAHIVADDFTSAISGVHDSSSIENIAYMCSTILCFRLLVYGLLTRVDVETAFPKPKSSHITATILPERELWYMGDNSFHNDWSQRIEKYITVPLISKILNIRDTNPLTTKIPTLRRGM